MKSNLAIRLIMDTENNKAYLSIEGKIEDATDKDKIKLRETLTNALSQVIGIDTSSQEISPEIVNDFEPAPSETPDFIKQELESKHEEVEPVTQEPIEEQENNSLQPEAEKPMKEPEELMEEFSGKGEVKLTFPAKYKGLTPYQVLSQNGESGYSELEKIIPVLEKNKEKYPKNIAVLKEIREALEDYIILKEKLNSTSDEGLHVNNFDKIVAEIKAMGDEVVTAVERLCRSRGTSLQAIINSRDEAELLSVYKVVMKIKNEMEESIK
jgi:hypothetical protein